MHKERDALFRLKFVQLSPNSGNRMIRSTSSNQPRSCGFDGLAMIPDEEYANPCLKCFRSVAVDGVKYSAGRISM